MDESDQYQSRYPQGLTYLFCLVCLIIPILYWPPAYDAAGVPREALVAICAGIGVLLYVIDAYRLVTLQYWHPTHLLILLLLAWVGISYFWSVDRGSSLLGITQFVSLSVIALLASRLSRKTIHHYLLPCVLLSAILAGLTGIFQNFGFNPFSFRQSGIPSSTFLNPNYAANYFDLMLPMSFAFLLMQAPGRKALRYLAAMAFTVTLASLIISHSRGSLLGLISSLMVLAIICIRNEGFRQLFTKTLRQSSRLLIISFAIVVVITTLPSKTSYTKKMESVISMTPDVSIDTRLDIYQNALVGFAAHPLLGVGYGAFTMGFSPYIDAIKPIRTVNQNRVLLKMHSDPLQMFYELGLPGGLLSLAIYIAVIVMCWRILRSEANPSVRILSLGLMLALIASGAHACVDFPLRLPTSAFYFWLWCGIVTGLYLRIYPTRAIKISRNLLAILGLAGLGFTIFSIYIYSGYLQANTEVRSAMENAMKGHCREVLRLSNNAMNDFGYDNLTRFWYAKVYTHCETSADLKLQAMNRILALDPNMPLPYLTRARIELSKGNLDNAATDFNTYRKFLSHEPEGYIGLAQVALRLNLKSQAKYWLNLAYRHVSDKQRVRLLAQRLKF